MKNAQFCAAQSRGIDNTGVRETVDDGVAQFFLTLEVVVEVALAHAAFAEDVVESRAMVALEVDQAGGSVETLMLARCGHSPHRDQPEKTLEAMAGFVRRLA